MNKRKVKITNTGYLPDSPDRFNDMNIIPSNRITMKDVKFPILGIDDLGNQQMMMPGGEYEFPGKYVTEVPLGKYQKGRQVPRVISDPKEFKIANQAYADSLSLYNAFNEPGLLEDARRENWNIVSHDLVAQRARELGEEIRTPRNKPYYLDPGNFFANGNKPTMGDINTLYPQYKKPTRPVVFEPPLERVEPRPITKLPVSETKLQPVNLSISKNRTLDSYDPNYTQKSGQLKKGTYYYDKDLKRWQNKPAEQEEIDYEREKGTIKKQQGGGIYMGDYEFKDGGLVKYQKKGQVSFDEYMMEGLRPQTAVQDNTYVTNPRVEEAKRDERDGMTPAKKVKAAATKKKIAEEEKKEQIKQQLLDQGEIKPATDGTERLKNQFIYAMDQPLDAVGSLMQRGYVPQGNLSGNYPTSSPMSDVIGAFNPASVLMDVGRVGRDLGEKETYTTWGGAGELGLNTAGFLPFGSFAKKVSKSIPPKTYDNYTIDEFFKENNIGRSVDDIELEGLQDLERKRVSIDRVPESGYSENFTRVDQQKAFDDATEFQKKWTYNQAGLDDYNTRVKPQLDEISKARSKADSEFSANIDNIDNQLESISEQLKDPNNFERFESLSDEFFKLQDDRRKLESDWVTSHDVDLNKVNELKNSTSIYDPEFERKVLDLKRANADRDVDKLETVLPNDKKNKLVYFDENDPSFQNLPEYDKLFLKGNIDNIGGVRTQHSTITLGTQGRPVLTTHLAKEKLPRSLSNPFKTKTKDVLVDVNQNRLIDPNKIRHTNAHEIAHDAQKIGKWESTLESYDPQYEYFTSHANNPIAADFNRAMVQPNAPKTYRTWASAPTELHAELSGARANLASELMKRDGLSMQQAIDVIKQDRDDFTDYLIETGNLNKHFKPETSLEEKRRLIKMLPAAVPAIGAGYVGSQLYNRSQEPEGMRDGGIYLGKYEFRDGGLVKMVDGGSEKYAQAIQKDRFEKALGIPQERIALQKPQVDLKNMDAYFQDKFPALKTAQEEAAIQKEIKQYETSPKFSSTEPLYNNKENLVKDYKKSADYKLRFMNESDYSEDDIKSIQNNFKNAGVFESKEIDPKNYKSKEEVIELQKFLASNGLMDMLGKYGPNKDGIDGIFGKKTREAVEKYNEHNKPYKEGVLDDVTKKAIKDFKNQNDSKTTLGIQTPLDLNTFIQEDGSANISASNQAIRDFEKSLNSKGYFKGTKFNTDDITEFNPRVAFKFKLNPDSKTPFGMCAQYVNGTICDEDAAGFEARENLGLSGSAWHISDNIQSKGGKLVFAGLPERDQVPDLKNKDQIASFIKSNLQNQASYLKDIIGGGVTWDSKVKPGDVVNIFYEGSNYTEEAYNQTKSLNNRLFTTHVGVVKADDQGKLFVEHNVHGKVEKDPLTNFLEGKVKGNGKNKVSMISGITRPNYYEGALADGSGIPEQGVNYYQTEYGKFNPKGALARNEFDGLAESISGKTTYKFLKTIENNKKALLKDIPISENEFDKLMRVSRAIPTLETYAGKSSEQVNAFEKTLQDTFLSDREKSMGLTKLKDETNLNEELRKKLIKSDYELDKPEKAALPTFYKIAKDYLFLKEISNNKGINLTADQLAKLSGIAYNQSVGKIAKDLVDAGSYDNYINNRRSQAKAAGNDRFKYEDLVTVYDKQTMKKGGAVEGIYLGKYEFKDGGLVKYQSKGQVDQKELERRAKAMGWNTVDEYKNANWKRNTKPSTDTSDAFDLTLDAASFVPGYIGMGASAIGLGKNLYEGDLSGAALDGLNIATAGAAKWLRAAQQTAKLANATKAANKVAKQAKLLETASNPLVPKTIGAVRDIGNYQWGENFQPFAANATTVPSTPKQLRKKYTPTEEYIKALKIEENGIREGFNKNSQKWLPHASKEGGNKTIAYGHKLTDEEVRKGTYSKGITEKQAEELFNKDLANHLITAERVYNNRHGKNAFDKVPDTLKDLIVDYTYNGVIKDFTKFTSAIDEYSNAKTPKEKEVAHQKMLKEYKRTSKGKDMVSRNAFTKKILDSIPVKQEGGSTKGKEYKTPTGQSIYLDPNFKSYARYLDSNGNIIPVTELQKFSMIYDPQDNTWDSTHSEKPLKIRSRRMSFEDRLNKSLGDPMGKAAREAAEGLEPGEDPVDNFRHPLAGMYTQQAIANKTGNIPIVSPALGWLGANIMGVGHELGTIFNDDRPLKYKGREALEDILNNATGTTIGLLPIPNKVKKEILYKASAKNMLPDGISNPDGRDFYFKNNGGSVRKVKIKSLPRNTQ